MLFLSTVLLGCEANPPFRTINILISKLKCVLLEDENAFKNFKPNKGILQDFRKKK